MSWPLTVRLGNADKQIKSLPLNSQFLTIPFAVLMRLDYKKNGWPYHLNDLVKTLNGFYEAFKQILNRCKTLLSVKRVSIRVCFPV